MTTNPSSNESIEYARIQAVLETPPESQRDIVLRQAEQLRLIVTAKGQAMSLNGALHAIERVGRVLSGGRRTR